LRQSDAHPLRFRLDKLIRLRPKCGKLGRARPTAKIINELIAQCLALWCGWLGHPGNGHAQNPQERECRRWSKSQRSLDRLAKGVWAVESKEGGGEAIGRPKRLASDDRLGNIK